MSMSEHEGVVVRKANDSRIQWFSLIRTIGVCFVLGYHFFPDSLPGGFIGVDIFYTFSGYLVTALALSQFEREGGFGARQFYIKRFARIVPPLFLSVLLTLPFALMLDSEFLVQLGRRIAATFSFTRNYYEILRGGSYENNLFPRLYVHTWSLSVEMQLYLVWGAILAILSGMARRRADASRSLKKMAAVGAMILAAFSYWQMRRMYLPDVDPAAAYYATHSHAFPFMLGSAFACMLGVSRYKGFESYARIAGKPLGALGVLASGTGLVILARRLAYADAATYSWGFLAASGLTVALIFSARTMHDAFPKSREPSIFTFISNLSYYIYLFHWPVYIVVNNSDAISYGWLSGWLSAMPDETARIIMISFVITVTLIASVICMYVIEPLMLRRKAASRVKWKAIVSVPLVAALVLCAVVVNNAPAVSPMSNRFAYEYLMGDARAMAKYASSINVASASSATSATSAASEVKPTLAAPTSITEIATLVDTIKIAVLGNASTLMSTQTSVVENNTMPYVEPSFEPTVRPTVAPSFEPTVTPTMPPLFVPNDVNAIETAARNGNAPYTTPAPTPTPAPAQIPIGSITMLGDSVILDAKTTLETGLDNCVVDAKVSRNILNGPELLKEYINKRKLGDTVVIALGSNGSRYFESLITEMIEALPDGHRIIFITPYDGRWTSTWASYKTTAYLRSIDGMYPYVTIGDWAAVVAGHNDWLTSDKVHLKNSRAITAYANVVKDAIAKAADTPVKGGAEAAVYASARAAERDSASAAAMAAGLPADVLISTKRNGVVMTSGNPLNIRANASTEGAYIGQVPHGKTVECYETTKSKGWLYIIYGDIRGYGSAQYVNR